MPHIAALSGRAVIRLEGPDRMSFLQGLTSNDVTKAEPGQAIWSALLTPQGRWLADFFIFAGAESLLLDAERAQAESIIAKLTRFRLRAKVILSLTNLHAGVLWNGSPPWHFQTRKEARPEPSVTPPDGQAPWIAVPDPRLQAAGYRLVSEFPIPANATEAEYHAHRIPLGLPDGTSDLEPERTLLLEAGFDELNGISWSKGCYMGQELTARTRYRGLVKRRLLPVRAQAAISPGKIYDGETEVGDIRSIAGPHALAMLRIDRLNGTLSSNGQRIDIEVPSWVKIKA